MTSPFLAMRTRLRALPIAAWKHAWLFPVVVFLVAFSIRAAHTNSGLPYIHHVDEPFVAHTALNMLKTGDLNPHWYSYGSLMVYLNVGVDLFHYVELMGQPYGDEPFMASAKDIRTHIDDGYPWTISHPSFYRWNRLLTALFGAGTVVFVFLLANTIFANRCMALVPALFLAFLPIHILHSAYVTVDVPSGFFVAGSVYFSMMYARRGDTRWLGWSLFFVGCAVATKYNAVLGAIMPLAAIIWRQCFTIEKPRPRHWLMLVLVPPLTFLVAMPYALFDFASFVQAAGYEVRHYKVIGHGEWSKEPGLEQLMYQLGEFWRLLGPAPSILALIGLAGVFWRRSFAFVLILPAAGLILMSEMTTSFHRNLLLLYPYVALMILSGLWLAYRAPALFPTRIRSRARMVSGAVVWGVTSLYLVTMAFRAVADARAAAHHVETRSAAISAVNELNDVRAVVVAGELKIHETDLRRLRSPRSLLPLKSIVQNKPESADIVYILPAGVTVEADGETAAKARLSRSYMADIFGDGVVTEIAGGDLVLDGLIKDPGIIIYRPPRSAVASQPIAPRFQGIPFAGGAVSEFRDQHWQVEVHAGETSQVMLFPVSRSAYFFTFDWTAADAMDPAATLEVVLFQASDEREVGRLISEDREDGYLDGDTMNHVAMQFTPAAPGPVVAVITIPSATKPAAEETPDSEESPAPAETPTTVYIKNIELRER